jgi:Rps23 Pro-64 3,4-dihydroxylase Tpa1-like proline 4-hydroxylase
MDRKLLADLIVLKIEENLNNLKIEFSKPGRINSCFIDDLLPEDIAMTIFNSFPSPSEMASYRNMKEYKKVAVQLNNYNQLLEEITFAFQDHRIVNLCEKFTGISSMKPDENLYAGGLSLMETGNFLNPHLDNSHDNDRENYRVLNLLYYVTPNWEEKFGGNLELWDNGMNAPQRTIYAKFNRLAFMITNKSSIHSVSKVVEPNKIRCCVSNYYFSKFPAENEEYFHVTSFYGRPEEPFKNFVLKLENSVRNLIRKITRKRILPTKHIYKK